MDELIPIFGILLAMIPVAGITAILTLRLGLKPFIDALSSRTPDPKLWSPVELALVLDDMQERIEALSNQVERLEDVRRFDRELLGSSESPDT